MVRLESLADGFHRQTGSLPLRIPVFESTDLITARPQLFDGFEGQHAVRASAVGDHLAIFRKLLQASLQLRKRYVECPWQVPQRELVFGADVEHRYTLFAQP